MLTPLIFKDFYGLLVNHIDEPALAEFKDYISLPFDKIPPYAKDGIVNFINWIVPPIYLIRNNSISESTVSYFLQNKESIELATQASGRICLKSTQETFGTAWMISEDIAITNDHVAGKFSRKTKDFFDKYSGDVFIDFKEQSDANDNSLRFLVEKVLYRSKLGQPDIALLQIKKTNSRGAALPAPLEFTTDIAKKGARICTIGFPQRLGSDSEENIHIPYKEIMEYRIKGIEGFKGISFGHIKKIEAESILHNCTAFKGSSGSCIIDYEQGKVVGLHSERMINDVLSYRAVSVSAIKKVLKEVQDRVSISILSDQPTVFSFLSAMPEERIIRAMPERIWRSSITPISAGEGLLVPLDPLNLKERKMSQRIEQIQEELDYLQVEIKKMRAETEKEQVILEGALQELQGESKTKRVVLEGELHELHVRTELEVSKLQGEIRKKQVALEGEAQALKLQAAILETKKHILSLEQDISEMNISSLTAHNKGCLYLIDADLEKKCDETILHVTAYAPTLGWRNVALSSVVYVMPPVDGIQDFILYGQAPSGPAGAAIETFQVSALVPSADWLQGVRIINSCGTSFLTIRTPVQEQAPIGDDSFGIEAACLKGDKLVIDVHYGGGCRQHTFQLNWDGKFLTSLPAQVRLELSHNANGDTCKAIIHERLQFDLSVIIEDPSQYVLHLGSMIAHVPNKNKVIVDDGTLPPI